jgi:hypothetical protein
MDALTLASLVSGLTGYSLRDVLRWISRKDTPRRTIATANARLLSIAAADDDPLCGRWPTSLWRYQQREGPSKPWQDSRYHVDGMMYVLFRHPGEHRWKATLLLNYTWQRGRERWMPLRLSNALDRRRGRLFKVVYDIELFEDSSGVFSGTATMAYRSPDIGRRYSARFAKLALTADGVLEGEFINTDPQPDPMPEARADVQFHHRSRWDQIDIE